MPYESRCRPTSPPTTAAPQFSVPVDVASHTGAMQAQEHRIQRWAVATRTRNPSQEALMSCFSQRITRIRRTESTWKSPEPRITRITRILHSSRQSSRIRVIRCFYNTPRNCFLQRITRIRRISLFTFILHSSFGAPRHHSSRQRTRNRLIRVIALWNSFTNTIL